MIKTRRLVLLALFVAIAGTLHVVESWLPLPLPIPGVKLGLANIVSLLVIILFGWRDALYVAIARVLVGSLFGGATFGPAFIMSMGGALSSVIVMAYIRGHYYQLFSLVGVSVLGAVAHNIAQIALAAVIVYSSGLLWYLPYLLLFAVPTGLFTGLAANYFMDRIPQKYSFKS